ncbi:MAG: hypothetical protein RLY78_825, partial [Pseudomonadota bacterium]
LLRAPLAPFQAEGALFSVVAGRALIADERGLGKSVQAMAAIALWRRHMGLQRVLLLCAPEQRAAWQRAWARFTGTVLEAVDGSPPQRQAFWRREAGVLLISPEQLQADAALIADWDPELVVVDEPQQLAGWSQLVAPFALVLCSQPLDTRPELLESLVDWLDPHRQGALAALRRVQAAQRDGLDLDEAALEQISEQLSRVMLQRQREEVAGQLPGLVQAERLVPMGPAQRAAHDAQVAQMRRLVARWQRSGWLSDSDQWALGVALQAAQQACQRAEPARADSALAEATLAALDAQLQDWADSGLTAVALPCATAADLQQLTARLLPRHPGLLLVPPESPLPETAQALLQVGAPWRARKLRGPDAPRGALCVSVVAQDSLEQALAETQAARVDAPRSAADNGKGFLGGEKLQAWLGAVRAALEALPRPVADA